MALSSFSSNCCWDYSFQLLQPDTSFSFQPTQPHFGFNNNNNNTLEYTATSCIDPTLFHYSDDELFYTDTSSSYANLLPGYFSSPSHNMISLSPEIFPPLEDFESCSHCPKRQRNYQDSNSLPNMFYGHAPGFLPEIPAPPVQEIQVPGSFSCGEKEKKENGMSLSVQSMAARERRRKITEKTQELAKLIPGGHRMNTAEMLQAAFKYVKFLQEQARLLRLMASIQERKEPFNTEELQILLASPIIQEKLYSEDKCLVLQEFVQTLANDPEIQSKPVVFEGIDQLLRERDG